MLLVMMVKVLIIVVLSIVGSFGRDFDDVGCYLYESEFGCDCRIQVKFDFENFNFSLLSLMFLFVYSQPLFI